MTEPYRASGFSCPVCAGAPLREVQNRLVCDRCQGMLVGTDDLLEALRDVGASATALDVRDVEPATASCPRCAHAMESCALHAGDHALTGRYLRCATDGIWVTQPQLVGELARTSRKASAGTRGLSASASALVDIAPSGSGTAALQGIGNAFTQNQRLPIGYRPPRVRIAFVSAFHGQDLRCPACAEHPALASAGDRWVCATCTGAFVENAALVAMVQDIRSEPWQLPKLAGAAGERACPVCSAAMVVEKLGAVTSASGGSAAARSTPAGSAVSIDRCEAHGTWFDPAELGNVLYQSSEPEPEPTGGVGGWLRRLFRAS